MFCMLCYASGVSTGADKCVRHRLLKAIRLIYPIEKNLKSIHILCEPLEGAAHAAAAPTTGR